MLATVLAFRNAVTKVQNFANMACGNENTAATIRDDKIILVDGDTCHLHRPARGNLHHTVTRTDYGQALAKDRIANGFTKQQGLSRLSV